MATPAPVGNIPDQPHDHNFSKHGFGQTSKFTDLFKVPGLAVGMDALCMMPLVI